jgi:hypothetical protein
MKALVLPCAVVLAVVLSAVANAQGNGCTQIVQNINDALSAIADNANSYWAHRANFVTDVYGPPNAAAPAVPDPQAADQEKSQADTVKAGMPGRVNSLKGLLTAAHAQGCQVPATVESAIKLAKRVNFDQFPPEEQLEEPSAPGPPRMPR